ncbi:hypothetical protein [Psychroserpens ponticola]|uniref:Uncharacterized protein n=1 Tax=Psychroserpens ponticola TaxID=2932268 RepID=A0ABY7S268_9FLAO|nr:hypothetical protein [Psychroserpens ponticola]WCO03479.1 hypothetical protein MUN68_008215 [Psychroserpens ponticola]
MKHAIKIFLFFFSIFCFAQNVSKEIKTIEGIWIAEDYYNSFEQTKSAIKSKNAFNLNYPVALRINSKDIKNGILNIGYSELHDHNIYPEVSNISIFKINLNKKDSIGYYKTTDISYFNYEWISYLRWNIDKNSLTLYRPKGNGLEEYYIKYKRVESKFRKDYLFPNPLYYYTRNKTLSGNYTLKDNLGNILSENFTIGDNGIVSGFTLLDNFTAYFSTDIYCGPPAINDLVMFFDDILIEEKEVFYFLYKKNENGNIDFHKRLYNKENGSDKLGEIIYELVKN